MKARLKFSGLMLLLGLIYIPFGFLGFIWWIITGNFVDIITKSIFKKMQELEKSFKNKP